jgi:hypothetical protein
MQTNAEQCEAMASKASDHLTAYTLRELAEQWRSMAHQLEAPGHARANRVRADLSG